MKRIKQLLLAATAVSLFGVTDIFAQQSFDLEKRGGHYYFTAAINDVSVDLMVESGIPALLVGKSQYEKCFASAEITFEPSQQKIRLLNKLYNIVLRAEGEVALGDVLYDGPIFILEGYNGVSIPIQYIKEPVSKRRVVMVDLKNNTMKVGATEELYGAKFGLSFDEELGFPIVKADIDITTSKGKAKIKGNLIVDFGNPSLLFLLKQHKSMAKVIEKGKIELKDAYNKKGEVVAQGIYAIDVWMLGREYHDVSIGVTDKMRSIKQLGFLGTQFFTSPVVFDFDKGIMFIR
ncbi:MAG: hypothetical protein Q4F45_08120 [Alistipes sp.]|nr:hypothetical protein [Alistipes sp.]